MKFSTAIPILAAAGVASAQSCPPIGEKNAEGLVSCDPKVQYPNGELCVLEGDCYFLEGTGLKIPTSTTSTAPTTTSCPLPGQTNSAGLTSCDPKVKEYPNGELCVLEAGCYFLEGTGLKTSGTMSSSGMATSTASCPAAGSTNAAGDYSCNPAHDYGNGDLCVLKEGCYYLEGTGLKTTGTGVLPESTSVVTAGGAHQTALGGFAAAFGLVAAML